MRETSQPDLTKKEGIDIPVRKDYRDEPSPLPSQPKKKKPVND